MRSLPHDLQGYLHVIKIPEKKEIMPLAYLAYVRPQKSISEELIKSMHCLSGNNRSSLNKEGCYDIIDNMIFEAILRKHPNAIRCPRLVMFVEELESVIAQFLGWKPYGIHIVLHDLIDTSFANNHDKKTEDIKLSLFTEVDLDGISREIKESIGKPELGNLSKLWDRYSPLMDTAYPLECRDNYNMIMISDKLKKCPVIDLYDVLKDI